METISARTVGEFARQMAQTDAAACREAGTEMDGEWRGEHTTALADRLGIPVREIDERILDWATQAYANETQRIA